MGDRGWKGHRDIPPHHGVAPVFRKEPRLQRPRVSTEDLECDDVRVLATLEGSKVDTGAQCHRCRMWRGYPSCPVDPSEGLRLAVLFLVIIPLSHGCIIKHLQLQWPKTIHSYHLLWVYWSAKPFFQSWMGSFIFPRVWIGTSAEPRQALSHVWGVSGMKPGWSQLSNRTLFHMVWKSHPLTG